MRVESVEIYSDATNFAVMRHPGRRFPGTLIQGDTLYSMCREADHVCRAARGVLEDDVYLVLNDLRNSLWERLNFYKSVLLEHGLSLPFSEEP